MDNANRNHANRPTAITPGDRARQVYALAKYDAAIKRTRIMARVYAIAYTLTGAGVMVAIFVAATN